MSEAKQVAAAAMESLGLTVKSEFMPFSQSRNKAEKNPSLNWKVTLQRNGRDVLTTDYMAGCGHCPAKASKAPSTYRAKDRRRADGKPYPGTTSNYRAPTEAEKLSDYLEEWRAAECETGLAMEHTPFAGEANFKPRRIRESGEVQSHTVPILPDAADVLYSLLSDSGVLNYSRFEEWAESLGYETDSRKAESIYRACLEIALQLRNAIGETGLQQLQAAFQDY